MSFILASASPRRKLLLAQAGLDFETIVSDVDESLFSTEGVTSAEHTKILALEKAKDVAKKFPDQLVMGADTVVDCNGIIIGKPDDAAHAEQITRMLFSQPHKVITGVALVRIADNTEIVQAATTVVYPKKLTEEQIADHITNGSWQGKAGAYGIQETGDEFVEKIEGSFTNVIGLPMELVKEMLLKANQQKP
ncbi:MAG: septum formation protein Maf [Planctomycetes bacterium]|nr:septum formation protein Maf [Planctomycetota bacterium]